MKTILIIDKPTNCMECPCFSYDLGEDWIDNTICNITGKEIEVIIEENEDDWLHYKAKKTPSYYHCPLKPMPKKKKVFRTGGVCGADENYGYNRCIDEILGER